MSNINVYLFVQKKMGEAKASHCIRIKINYNGTGFYVI